MDTWIVTFSDGTTRELTGCESRLTPETFSINVGNKNYAQQWVTFPLTSLRSWEKKR